MSLSYGFTRREFLRRSAGLVAFLGLGPVSVVTKIAQAQTAFDWQVEVVDEGASKPVLALDVEGRPHIAYMLEAQRGFLKHAVKQGSEWNISTITVDYLYGPPAITVDGVTPHITYHNHTFEDQIHASFDGSRWVNTRISHSGHDGWDNSLIVDSQGKIHASSVDPSGFGGAGIEYAVFDGERWQVERVGTRVMYAFGTSIALNPQGEPRITFFNDQGGALFYASREAGRWRTQIVDGDLNDRARGTGMFSSLRFDSRGEPVISYYEHTSRSGGMIKLATRVGDVWEIQEIDRLNNVSLGFVGARNLTSLVLDEADRPRISYSDERMLKLALYDGTAWNIETAISNPERPLGQMTSLDYNGEAFHIATFDVASQSPLNGRILYIRGVPR
ncbi:MAG: hypothetical protein ACE5JP_04705 [Candidatus Bipolaricaulia bacterium]